MKNFFILLLVFILIGVITYRLLPRTQPLSNENGPGTGTSTVTVPPPIATSSDLTSYENIKYGFTLDFPKSYIVNPNINYEFMTNNSVVRIDLPAVDTKGTNLGEAMVIVGASQDKAIVASCLATSTLVENETNLNIKKEINGLEFNKFKALGAGAGNRYDSEDYRAVANGTCYELVLMMHYGIIENYPPGAVKEFDRSSILSKLEKVAFTFKLK